MDDLERRYAMLKPRGQRGLDEERPLSYMEQNIWRAARAVAGSGASSFALYRTGWSLSGPLDVAAMVASIAALGARHDTMRTCYLERAGGPVARVQGELPGTVRVVDCKGGQDAVDAEVERETARGFDLAVPPLQRFLLLQLGPDQHHLYVFVHHATCDGVSMSLILRDLAHVYECIVGGAPPPPMRPIVQHSDFALWQHSWRSAAADAEYEAFWQRHLRRDLVRPPLRAITTPAPADRRDGWALHRSFIEQGMGASLYQFCQARRVSVTGVLLTVLGTIANEEGAGDSPVGIISANRRRQTRRTIGNLASMFPIVAPVSAELSFDEAVGRTERTLEEALRWQDLPPRFTDGDSKPPYRVVLNFTGLNRGPNVLPIRGISSSWVLSFKKSRALVDLWLNVRLHPTGPLALSVERNTDLISETLLATFLARLEAGLRAFLQDPARRIGEARVI